ncbi:hypothetical protein BC940DRAFT_296581 [Gongronella butleri]|nr:hypothetical protein BC940DRAFT_296581 [Gongronella butleri]
MLVSHVAPEQLVYTIDCDKYCQGSEPPVLILRKETAQAPVIVLKGVIGKLTPVIRDERQDRRSGFIVRDERWTHPWQVERQALEEEAAAVGRRRRGDLSGGRGVTSSTSSTSAPEQEDYFSLRHHQHHQPHHHPPHRVPSQPLRQAQRAQRSNSPPRRRMSLPRRPSRHFPPMLPHQQQPFPYPHPFSLP